jgi:demethylmenaquinone methyltransferase/2-methoxy-6-polyprenyl-1,4-benzoquinol methylase
MSSLPKHELVQNIFDRIAARYDLLNRIISFRLDTLWRKRAVRAMVFTSGRPLVLDLGSGTGDLAIAGARAWGQARIVGLDFSHAMLRLAMAKKERVPGGERISFVLGSALNSPFRDGAFDAVMTAFVLRNISDLGQFFQQAYRLLRPGGQLLSLDMFPPTRFPFSFFYSCYFYLLVPWIGALVARDRGAYQYLSDSVRTFHAPETVAGLISQSGFQEVKLEKFLNGAVCLHLGKKSGAAR